MVIQSAFKDYYDFVANQYGGGDPRIVYARGPVGRHTHDGWQAAVVPVRRFPLADPAGWPRSDADFSLAYAIVAGRPYLLWRPRGLEARDDVKTWRLADPDQILERDRGKRWWRWGRGFAADHGATVDFGKEHPDLIVLTRQIGHPVFVVTHITWSDRQAYIRIAAQCPILATLGFPAVIAPQQMYQDLAYFLGNTMKPAPDTKPPVEVANREKILKAGFDLKQSFRHRI